MSASLGPSADDPSNDDTSAARATSLAQWLRARTDEQLIALLRRRPDLALPAPPDLGALAARIGVRTSTQRAVDALDAPTLHALELLVLAAGEDDAVDDPAPVGLTDLFDLALVWGETDLVHLTTSVRESVGPYPDGLGRPVAALARLRRTEGVGNADIAVLTDPGRLAAQLADCDDAERKILDRLAQGPPVGTVRNPTSPADPGHRLIARGLLVPIDTQRVELPREVALALRAQQDRSVHIEAPDLAPVIRTPQELDELATTAVRETLRLIDQLAETWTRLAPPLLRSGGLGVRELRRTARALDVDESTAALLAEVAYAAGLINSTNSPDPVFLPSEQYDSWCGRDDAGRWITLAAAWLTMTRQPSLVNERGERDRVITALGPRRRARHRAHVASPRARRAGRAAPRGRTGRAQRGPGPARLAPTAAGRGAAPDHRRPAG